jgi:hypothetical protein
VNDPTTRSRLDWAVLWLGLVAAVSPVTALATGDLDLFRLRGVGVGVTVVLGVLAAILGWLALRRLALVSGLGFLVAAAVQLAQLRGVAGVVERGLLDGTASTFAFWLGIGAGLTALALAPEPEAEPMEEET